MTNFVLILIGFKFGIACVSYFRYPCQYINNSQLDTFIGFVDIRIIFLSQFDSEFCPNLDKVQV